MDANRAISSQLDQILIRVGKKTRRLRKLWAPSEDQVLEWTAFVQKVHAVTSQYIGNPLPPAPEHYITGTKFDVTSCIAQSISGADR